MLTGNKGEWSELYVFLKLLGDGVLYAADEKLNKKEDLYYPLVEVLRTEHGEIRHYVKEDVFIKIVDINGRVLLRLSANEFATKAEKLLSVIKKSDVGTFPVPDIEAFMHTIGCSKIKADSKDKSDITLVLHDEKIQKNGAFNFSIKSRLGKSSTLFNAGKCTNFIYEIDGSVPKKTEKLNVKGRVKFIYGQGAHLHFIKTESETFEANLCLVDSLFSRILSEYILEYYLGNGKTVRELTERINEKNPCGFNTRLQHPYEYKMKHFLTAIALGMMPSSVWDGYEQTTGGYIIVKEDGDVLCYHLYNRNEFRKYLFQNTRFDTPSSSRHDFGYIYRENRKFLMKLNFQIRFI